MQRVHPARSKRSIDSRERRAIAGSSIVASSTAVLTCLAPAFVQAIPGIVGTPLFYKHELNAELIYDLCAALVRAGIARPEDWEPCRADALSFAKPPAMKAIGAERGELLRRNVEFQMEIAMHIRSGTCTTETQDSAVVHSLFLSLVLAPVFFDLGKSSMHWSGKRKGWNRCAHSPGRSASTSTRSRCPGSMRAFDCCRRTSTSS